MFEIAGVDPRLNTRWSSRRHRITATTSTLVAQFEADHERPPTPTEKLDLAQQATLGTRPGKHQPRSEADQRAIWAAEAHQVLGRGGIDHLLQAVWSQPRVVPPVVDEAWIGHTAQQVLNVMEADRSSWTPWNVRSEALRQVRAAAIPLHHIRDVVDRVVERALTSDPSVPILTTRAMPVEPDLLRRPDATSVYEKPSATRYTSRRILWAERRLIDTAGRLGGRVVDHNSVTLALLQSMANREPLNPGQQLLVRDMATSGRRLQLAIAPAGTGKTTAMRALATAWTSSGGTIVGLPPSNIDELSQQTARLLNARGSTTSLLKVRAGAGAILDDVGRDRSSKVR